MSRPKDTVIFSISTMYRFIHPLSGLKHIANVLITFVTALCFGVAQAEPSVCYGTSGNGRLEGGVQLPGEGRNFVAYSTLARWLGRTYVHSTVKTVILDAYKRLETEQPSKVYKYAETGFREGGKFRPHKTHQNGLSVDFIVPAVDANGKSVYLPTHALNKYGYGIDFDADGLYDSYRIDFEAMGAHIVALHKAAVQHGIELTRVIFDPRLQPMLYATQYGGYIKQHIFIPKKKSWVRHDDHYHVDFAVRCMPMK
jgi:penicillin-insensitive murein endopeptidase